eukprot:6226923-Amphidinium_carterae.1
MSSMLEQSSKLHKYTSGFVTGKDDSQELSFVETLSKPIKTDTVMKCGETQKRTQFFLEERMTKILAVCVCDRTPVLLARAQSSKCHTIHLRLGPVCKTAQTVTKSHDKDLQQSSKDCAADFHRRLHPEFLKYGAQGLQ